MVFAAVVTQVLPRLQPATGTVLIVGSGRAAGTVAPTPVRLHGSGGWSGLGNVSGDYPAAPSQRELLAVSVVAGTYDGVSLGPDSTAAAVTVTAGQVEPILVGLDAGHMVAGAVYAGNDQVNLGLGELSGKFVPMPAFSLSDQDGGVFDSRYISGRDLVIAAFNTSCHQTCPLYTALFFQLQRHLPGGVSLVEVTTDPAHDTPSVLRRYAQSIGAGWTFVTGTAGQLAAFWKPFGVSLASGDTHVSTLALVDRHGYVRLVYRGVPSVGHDVPPALITTLGPAGLSELASGGDGWGSPDVLSALLTITGPEIPVASAGGRAPAFSLATTAGGTVSLGQLAGHPLVINFWASYCPPCRAEMPMLQRVVGARSSVQLVLVDEADSREVAAGFLRSVGVTQPALLDSDLSVGHQYGAIALPTTVFVRADGTVAGRQVGQLDETVLAAELATLGD
ncbi:MAG TPA: redoxin family protein [Candidatus Dormibacteraeota bacterium]|nr:redoxin family protein [Candidatus Dormibacteraeota bacterium]